MRVSEDSIGSQATLSPTQVLRTLTRVTRLGQQTHLPAEPSAYDFLQEGERRQTKQGHVWMLCGTCRATNSIQLGTVPSHLLSVTEKAEKFPGNSHYSESS